MRGVCAFLLFIGAAAAARFPPSFGSPIQRDAEVAPVEYQVFPKSLEPDFDYDEDASGEGSYLQFLEQMVLAFRNAKQGGATAPAFLEDEATATTNDDTLDTLSTTDEEGESADNETLLELSEDDDDEDQTLLELSESVEDDDNNNEDNSANVFLRVRRASSSCPGLDHSSASSLVENSSSSSSGNGNGNGSSKRQRDVSVSEIAGYVRPADARASTAVGQMLAAADYLIEESHESFDPFTAGAFSLPDEWLLDTHNPELELAVAEHQRRALKNNDALFSRSRDSSLNPSHSEHDDQQLQPLSAEPLLVEPPSRELSTEEQFHLGLLSLPDSPLRDSAALTACARASSDALQ